MSQSGSGCKYPLCIHPLYHDEEYCIFHLPKLAAEQIKELTPEKALEYYNFEEKFREEFFALLNKINSDQKKKYINFVGFKFVDIDLRNETLKEKIFGWDGFQKIVNFSGATFQEADFRGGNFQEAYFTKATFQKADFSEATFQEADFIGTKFQKANFSEATFQEADFSEATFQEADFTGAIFQDAKFWEVTFHEAYFSVATFHKKAQFSYSKVQKGITFWGFDDDRIFKGECKFDRIDTEPGAKIIFEKVNLEKASFLGTNSISHSRCH